MTPEQKLPEEVAAAARHLYELCEDNDVQLMMAAAKTDALRNPGITSYGAVGSQLDLICMMLFQISLACDAPPEDIFQSLIVHMAGIIKEIEAS